MRMSIVESWRGGPSCKIDDLTGTRGGRFRLTVRSDRHDPAMRMAIASAVGADRSMVLMRPPVSSRFPDIRFSICTIALKES